MFEQNGDLIDIKTHKEHQYYTLPYNDIKKFIMGLDIEPFEGGMYAALYMMQCKIDKMTAYQRGLRIYYFERSMYDSPLSHIFPQDHHKYLIEKYMFHKSALLIGLIVGRHWAEYKINNSPFSWIDIENEIKG